MATIKEQATAYEASRRRIDALARGLDGEALARTVPCCPAWSVKDLVGHLVGLLEDRRDARMPVGGFEEWTDQQVTRHRDEPVGVVLDLWGTLDVEQSDAAPSLAALSFDVVSHEHDLYQALGVSGDRESDSVRVGSERAMERMGTSLVSAGAPGVRVTTESGTVDVPGGPGSIGLTTTRYGIMRLVTGRVSRTQAESMSWDSDPAAVLDALFSDGFFTLQPVDVIEADAL